ncbi:AfsR/SARP family transcriptional regulator [Streptomyces sp. PmtG]
MTALTERVWGAHPPIQAANSLQVYVARLRRLLKEAGLGEGGASIRREVDSYRLALPPHLVDLHRARRVATEAEASLVVGDDADAAISFRKALGIWGVHPLADIDGEWAEWMRAALIRERNALLIRCADAELRLGRHFQLLAELPQLAAEYPTEEELVRRAMIALYRCGFRDEAMRLFNRLRATLSSELGVEPGGNLQALFQSILRGEEVMVSLAIEDRAI